MRVTAVREEFSQILEEVVAGKEPDSAQVEYLLTAEGEEIRLLVRGADELRKRQVGETVTYVINRNINFTNICINNCRFCAFRRPPGHPEAFLLAPEQIKQKVREALAFGATEVCVQGGIHPGLRLDYYLEVLHAIREVSEDIHIHAFSPQEVSSLAEKENMPVGEVLRTLKREGLGSMPGTAAEILSDRVRGIICPKKIGTKRWAEIIETAHRLGIPTTSTIMYGTVESLRERAEHLLLLREIQKRTGGFTEFIPLPFVGEKTELGREVPGPSMLESLRLHAVARLVLGRYIRNLQASWVKLGPRGAQLMLLAGANDLGGTLLEENITREAGGRWGQCMTPERLRELILEIGRIPAQRSTLYEILASA
jgi:FO synthase subunit 2